MDRTSEPSTGVLGLYPADVVNTRPPDNARRYVAAVDAINNRLPSPLAGR